MAGFDHQLLVELFRNRPDLARDLLELCRGIRIEASSVELGPTDLSEIAPSSFLTDSVHICRDEQQRVVTGIIVEVQQNRDGDKRYTWPVYVTSLRARIRAPVVLVVLAPDAGIARWCRKPIDLGAGFTMTPTVITFDEIPRISEVPADVWNAELAVLSTLAHPDLHIARLAFREISRISGDTALVYSRAIRDAVPESEADMITRHEIEEIKAEARRLREERWAEGKAEGKVEGLADAALVLLRARLNTISPDLEQRVREHADLPALLARLASALDETATLAVLRHHGLA